MGEHVVSRQGWRQKIVSRQKRLSRHKVGDRKVVSRQKSCLETMSEAKKLSQDNAFVSDLVFREHVCPSRDNQNDQRQQKRQPTAVDPAEGKLRKITTQGAPRWPAPSFRFCVKPVSFVFSPNRGFRDSYCARLQGVGLHIAPHFDSDDI